MRIFLITVLLLPTAVLAQKACYSPSDCVGMEHCTSLDDGIVPGRCTTDARIINKKPVKPAPVVVKKSSSSKSSIKSSSSSSKSSSIASSSSSSSVSTLTDEQQKSLAASIASMMQSFMSMGKSLTNMLSGIAGSLKCAVGGC